MMVPACQNEKRNKKKEEFLIKSMTSLFWNLFHNEDEIDVFQ